LKIRRPQEHWSLREVWNIRGPQDKKERLGFRGLGSRGPEYMRPRVLKVQRLWIRNLEDQMNGIPVDKDRGVLNIRGQKIGNNS
jgi:hypothetical protein